MNVKWKLCVTFVVCNVKRWWQQWQPRWKWRRSQAKAMQVSEKKIETQMLLYCSNPKNKRIPFHFMWFHYTFFLFLFSACIFAINSFFLLQAKVTLVINSCSPPQKKETEKNVQFELGFRFVLTKTQIEKQTMWDLIQRLKEDRAN